MSALGTDRGVVARGKGGNCPSKFYLVEKLFSCRENLSSKIQNLGLEIAV